jgi:hypothetical protein
VRTIPLGQQQRMACRRRLRSAFAGVTTSTRGRKEPRNNQRPAIDVGEEVGQEVETEFSGERQSGSNVEGCDEGMATGPVKLPLRR